MGLWATNFILSSPQRVSKVFTRPAVFCIVSCPATRKFGVGYCRVATCSAVSVFVPLVSVVPTTTVWSRAAAAGKLFVVQVSIIASSHQTCTQCTPLLT